MSTIQSTVQSSLDANGVGQYSNYAAPVVEALQAREDSIKDALRQFASDKGLSSEEVDEVFVLVGFNEPEPEPEPEPEVARPEASNGFEQQMLDALNDLTVKVERITQAAARHGVHV